MAKAKRIDQELFDRLRKSGLRKSVARQLATAGKAANDRAPDRLRRTVSDLTDVLGDLEKRVPGRGAAAARSQAAQKAARTRKRAATRRSTAAKKGAATRARSTGSSTTSRSSGSRTTSRSSGSRSTGSRSTGSRSTGSRRRTGTSRSR